MDKIYKYINSIFKGMNSTSKETEDLKQEMKNHLVETAKELQENGLSEDEIINIAIERFGDNFQIRNELNEVLRFQKLFAQKTLISSFIFLILSTILLLTAFFINQSYSKRYNLMNSQIKNIEKKLVNEGFSSVDTYLKEIFKDEKNIQITYIAIKEIPQNFDYGNIDNLFAGKTKYTYPKTIKNEYYNNRLGHEVVVNNIKYLLEIGAKTSANTDNSSLYIGLAILTFAICWVLWIIWSIINVSNHGNLNTKWCMLLIFTGIIGYFIYSISINPNNTTNNTRKKLIYISIFCLAVISLGLFYTFKEPYRVQRLFNSIFLT